MKATCFYCRTGKYNACPDVVFFSTPPFHGTLARYHVHPQEWLHKLPDSLSFEEGSLLEPLSVALAGIDRSMLRLGDATVICGAGPIGLVTLLAAHAAGANPIVITDLDENRLATAKKLIPRVNTVQITMGEEPKEVAARITKALGAEAKLVFECTGVESSVQSAIYVSHFSTRCSRSLLTQLSLAPLEVLSSSSAVARISRTSHFPTCLQERSISSSSTVTRTPTPRPLDLLLLDWWT